MTCPRCGRPNPETAGQCAACGAALSPDIPTRTGLGGGSAPTDAGSDRTLTTSGVEPSATGGYGLAPGARLAPGTLLGTRYEILAVLGEGGMGTVYKAQDRELRRLVALKVIRPEMASRPEILERFKQELILARQVTHKNVIRIFDLGDADGIKFITMEYIRGQDLRTLLRQKDKFQPEEAAKIIQQVCRALEAAHGEGVIHRDLKPQNIMVDSQGKVTVMDFGIARSMEMPGMTHTGVLIGTPEYMSPEQVNGEPADARSDLFSAGLIFYELLTGKSPYQAATSLASLLKRTHERPTPPVKLDPSIPGRANDIVLRCLELNPRARYQSAQEVLNDLEVWLGVRPGFTTPVTVGPAGLLKRRWQWSASAAAVLLVVTAALVHWEMPRFKGQAVPKAVSLLIADFQNMTSEPVFDGTLEPTFSVALEGAAFITSYDRGQARKAAAQLQSGASGLGESQARLIAVREGISVVVAGSIARKGDGYKIFATAMDATTGKPLYRGDAEAAAKQGVLTAVGTLAARIRKALGDTTPESVQIAAAETFTTTSLEAAHEYAVAQSLQWAGKWDDAIQHYSEAAQLDPDFGRAYAGLAAVSYNTGRLQDSEKYYMLALSKIDRMSDREKFRTRGGYYLAQRNPDKAIAEYSQLIAQYPSDAAGTANLAFAYFLRRDMARALEEGRRAVEIYPKNVIQRNNIGLYAMYEGDFEIAIREQRTVLELNPSFALGHVGMALSLLAEGRTAEATEAYQRLDKLGPRGASDASTGLADLALYEGRTSDAVNILEKGIAADFENKSPDGAANKLAMLANAHLLLGQTSPAGMAADKALASSGELSVLFWAARVYLDLGRNSKAVDLVQRLGSRLEPDPQAYAKLIQGGIELKRGKAANAVRLFREAQKIADTWLGHFDLGRAYLEAGAFTEAYSEFEACLKRRGEATAAFLDEVPTYRLLPPVYYYLGRAQGGLKSPAAADSYRTLLAIKTKGENDPLVVDARRRLAQR